MWLKPGIIAAAANVIGTYVRYTGLADEFEGTSTLITARPNWTFPDWDNVSGSDSSPEWFQTDTDPTFHLGFLHLNASNKNSAANPAALYFGAGQLSGDFVADFGYDTTGLLPTGTVSGNYNTTAQSFRVWQQDKSNYIDLVPDVTNNRVIMSGMLNGSTMFFGTSTAVYWSDAKGAALNLAGTRGELHTEAFGGKMRVRINGNWLVPSTQHTFPFEYLNLSNWVTAGKNAGAIGLKGHSTTTTPTRAIAQYIRGRNNTVWIDFIDQFVGRDSTTASGGTARLEISYTGTPVQWVGRVLKQADDTVVSDWTPLLNVAANGAGKITANIYLPMGGPYYTEIGYVGSDNLLYSIKSRPTASGYKVLFYGQSNSNGRMGTGAASYQGTMTGAAGQWLNKLSGATPAQTPGSGSVKGQTREIGSAMSAWPSTSAGGAYNTAKILTSLLGVPVCVQVQGSDGTGIEPLSNPSYVDSNGTGVTWNDFVNGLPYAPGICEVMLWDQGEADADYTAGPSGYYATKFDTQLLPNVRAAVGNPNMPALISPVGRYATTGTTVNGLDGGIDRVNREALRQQYLLAVAGDPLGKTYISDSKLGVAHAVGNPYHYPTTTNYPITEGSYDEICRRGAYSIAKYAFGMNIYDGRGPLATSASRSGSTITITLDLNGATSINYVDTGAGSTGDQPAAQANTVKGYQVSADNFNTLLPIADVTTDGTHLTITLVSDPGAAVKIRSFYGWDYDDTKLFWGHAYTDGRLDIPVYPIVTPLVAS